MTAEARRNSCAACEGRVIRWHDRASVIGVRLRPVTWPPPPVRVERSDLLPWSPLRVDRAMGVAPALWIRNGDMVVEGSNERSGDRAAETVA
jgi:hypothetical protein